ncbi:hypothetical protein B296_00001523 [Ensete ventricosum]|uniref:Uncharacterized protein n=1 Tax=Ensete ventricosum TaxID=4639 RepID=A0A426ZP83_ENSVE|nr:hypothetical protein B296_00001523 [Ensete ventricosum]
MVSELRQRGGGAARYGLATCKGPTGYDQAPYKGRPPAWAAAARKGRRDRQRPTHKGLLPAECLQGGDRQRPAHSQPCRLRRGNGGDGAKEGKERARTSF